MPFAICAGEVCHASVEKTLLKKLRYSELIHYQATHVMLSSLAMPPIRMVTQSGQALHV